MSTPDPYPEKLVLTHFTLNPGQTIKIIGFIPENAKYLAFNLGKNEKNLSLHFNPRFDYWGDKNTIVFNSMKDNKWETEHREKYFPFHRKSPVEFSITFNGDDFTVNLPQKLTFPNRYAGDTINFFSVRGDFTPKDVAFL